MNYKPKNRPVSSMVAFTTYEDLKLYAARANTTPSAVINMLLCKALPKLLESTNK